MNTERLLRARAIMEHVRDAQKPFYMFGSNFAENDCNTAACFFGWCCRDKQFKAEGLTIIRRDSARSVPAVFHENCIYLTEADACAAFFDISYAAAGYLVFASSYHRAAGAIKPEHVIEHLDELLSMRQERYLVK